MADDSTGRVATATATAVTSDRYRIVLVAALGLLGCVIALIATAPSQPASARTLLAAGFGLFLAFVGLAGILDAVRS